MVTDTIGPVLPMRLPVRHVLLVLAALSTPAAGQAADPKAEFLDALGRFSLALTGHYGDESGRMRAALESLERARNDWDQVIRRYETAMQADVAGAAPPLAARMHVALGAVYLD